MKVTITQINGEHIAEVNSENVLIRETQDALDLIANCDYQGSRKIIIKEKNLTPDFFNLKSGFAGEVLQKFSNYNVCLAIIGDFYDYPSKSLKDFIYESNKVGRINFVSSREEAIDRLIR
ncbi:MAG: DUF4180 domain-containing protein [Bacteroidales bacterium]